METKVYTPFNKESILKLFIDIVRDFKNGRELAWRLFVRDRKASYRKSFLGYFWIFIPPLGTSGVWIFLSAQKVLTIQATPMKYAGFTLCGTMLWSLFAEGIAKPMQRYQGAMGMMSKLNFPREAIILTTIYDLAASFFLRLLILIPALWMLGYPPTLYFIPALLAAFGLSIAGLAIGVFLTPIGLLFGDIGRAITLALPFLMYMTPVVYPIRRDGILGLLQKINPVTPFLERARSLFGGYEFAMQTELLFWSLGLLLVLAIGLIATRLALPIIVERAGS